MDGATAGESAGCGSLRGLPLVSAKSPACVTGIQCTRRRSSWRRNFGGSVCGGMTYYVSGYTTQDLSRSAHTGTPLAVLNHSLPDRRANRLNGAQCVWQASARAVATAKPLRFRKISGPAGTLKS